MKKFGLASKNESYVINALQFIGLIDEQGKKIDSAADVLLVHDEAKFQEGFAALVKAAYADLFDTRGDDAWTLNKDDLIGYFRAADKISDVIGMRQAGVFQAFSAIAGYEPAATKGKPNGTPKPKERAPKQPKPTKPDSTAKQERLEVHSDKQRREMAMTVRIEINLPAEGSRETCDTMFQSIRANLIDE